MRTRLDGIAAEGGGEEGVDMRFKNLEGYKTGGDSTRMQLSIPVPKTPAGRVYRYSPNEHAHPRHFLLGGRAAGFPTPTVLSPRMTHLPGKPGTVCPYSGILDEDEAFIHPDDIGAAKALVAHAAKADVVDAFHGMFKDLSRRFAGNKHVRFKAGRKPREEPKPRFDRQDLLRELACDECGRDYGVYAISLFCPDCGAPNIHLHFAREGSLVREQVELAGTLGPERRELAYRMLGNAHEDVLGAFEATLKTVYLHGCVARPAGAPAVKLVGNDFQNIERGRNRYAEFGLDPFGVLAPRELGVLSLNIQKRHVIGHNLSVADEKFVKLAGEARVGETVPLLAAHILEFADVCQTVVDGIDAWLANGTPPPRLSTVAGGVP